MRHYTIHHAPGAQLTFDERQILGRDWNDRILHGRMPTLRGFARDHGIAFETWRREYERGRMGETVPDPDHRGRRIYALYDPNKAQDEKGSVENCNRIVRRWYPKGTDFALVSRADARKLEDTINGIHRLSLGGRTAAQYDEELAKAA